VSAFIPVAPDRWAELVQASAEVGPLRNKVSDLKTELELRQVEIARLTAENERLRKAGDAMDEYIKKLEERITVIAAKEGKGAK
jgi:regulator of replication initiation timing